MKRFCIQTHSTLQKWISSIKFHSVSIPNNNKNEKQNFSLAKFSNNRIGVGKTSLFDTEKRDKSTRNNVKCVLPYLRRNGEEKKHRNHHQSVDHWLRTETNEERKIYVFVVLIFLFCLVFQFQFNIIHARMYLTISFRSKNF